MPAHARIEVLSNRLNVGFLRPAGHSGRARAVTRAPGSEIPDIVPSL